MATISWAGTSGNWNTGSNADFFLVPFGSTIDQDFINNGLITIAAGGTFDVQTNVSIQSLGSIVGPGGLLRFDYNDVLTSDGAGIDGLGQTVLAPETVPVDVTVLNYAAPVLSGTGLTTVGPNAYVLNLGTAEQGAAPLSATLNVGNGATGAADWLNGTATVSGDPAFTHRR